MGFVIVTFMLILFGLGRVSQATKAGMGLEGDAYWYATAAENLAQGRGFGRLNGRGELVPTTHFPPFYPATMAGLQILGVDRLETARWINLVSFTALVFLAGAMLRRETRSNYAAYAAEAILVTSTVVFGATIWALSEPLYLALGLAGLWVLSLYLEHQSWWTLLASAVLIGLGSLTRYVGISLVGTALLMLLLRRTSWRRRLVDIGLFLTLSLIPVILWWLRNVSLTGNFADRRLIWHPITYAHVKALVLHFVEWFVPAEFIGSGIQAVGLLLILTAIGAALVVRMHGAGRLTYRFRRQGMPFLLALYAGLYVLALGLSLSLFDAFTSVGDRILSPVYVSVMLLAVLLMWEAWNFKIYIVRAGILAGVVFILIWNGGKQAKLASSYEQYGLGNAAPGIKQSPTIAAVRELPDVPIVTNVIPRLYFWADRDPFSIPWQIDIETEEIDPLYESNLAILRSRLCEQGGFLVLFEPETMVSEHAALSDLRQGLALYGQFRDGEIYQCAES
jgi:flagellar biosynthesis protein FliQ